MWVAGSVSVGVWQMACKRVIAIGERMVKDLAGELSRFLRRPILTLIVSAPEVEVATEKKRKDS